MSATTLPLCRRLLALVAAVLLNVVFGSLYAWSVFIAGLETDLLIMRTDVSLVFSLAIVAFTAGNFIAPYLFGRVPTAGLPVIATALAGGGLALAAMGDGYMAVTLGYGVLFGFGSGMAYNTALQAGQHALPDQPGLANGIVIAAFAVGGMAAAYLLSDSITDVGVRATFWRVAAMVGAIGGAAAVLLGLSAVDLPRQERGVPSRENRRFLQIAWLGFFLGAFAGVMAIGHAAAIIQHFGGTAATAVLGVTLMGFGNAVGRFGAGWLSDIVSVRSVAGIAHLTGAFGFIVVLANPSGDGALVAMTMAGIAYGMSATVYPAAVSMYLGRAQYGRNFAILLTAWGAAGLLGPFIGGYFYDFTSDYRISIEFACIAAGLAVFNAMRLPRDKIAAS